MTTPANASADELRDARYFVQGVFRDANAEFKWSACLTQRLFVLRSRSSQKDATINKHALYCPTVTIDHYSGKTTERHITSTRFVRIL